GNAASRHPGNMPKVHEEDSQETQRPNTCPRNANRGLLVLETGIALAEGPNHFSERPQLAQTLHERRATPPLNDHLYRRVRQVHLSPFADYRSAHRKLSRLGGGGESFCVDKGAPLEASPVDWVSD